MQGGAINSRPAALLNETLCLPSPPPPTLPIYRGPLLTLARPGFPLIAADHIARARALYQRRASHCAAPVGTSLMAAGSSARGPSRPSLPIAGKKEARSGYLAYWTCSALLGARCLRCWLLDVARGLDRMSENEVNMSINR